MQEREERARKRMAGQNQTDETTCDKPSLKEQCEQMPVTIRSITSQSSEAEDQTADTETLGDEPEIAIANVPHGKQDDGKKSELKLTSAINTPIERYVDAEQGTSQPASGSQDDHFGSSVRTNLIQELQTSKGHTNKLDNNDSSNVQFTDSIEKSKGAERDKNQDLPTVEDLKVKFGNQATSFEFTKNVAAMAAAQSHNMAGLNVETFGDSDDSEEEVEEGVCEE